MPDQPSPDECAQWLRALAEPIRLKMIRELLRQPQTVTALANRMGVEIATASHHLQVLLRAGLLSVERQGRFSTYQLNSEFHRRLSRGRGGRFDFGCCRFELF